MAPKEKREHHNYRRGGRPKSDKPAQAPADAPAPNKSWEPGNKGQGGEGLSEGYVGARATVPGHQGRRITRNRNDKAKPELLYTSLEPPEGAS